MAFSGDTVSSSGGSVAVGGPWSDGSQTNVTIVDVSDPASPALQKAFRFEGSLASSRLIGSKLHLVITTLPRLPANPTPANVEAMTLDEWLPEYQTVQPDGTTSSAKAAEWDTSYRPDDPNGYAMTVIATLDVDHPDTAPATTTVTANVGTVYASTQALYLTDTDYSYDDYGSRSDTMVHKLAFTTGGTEYVASGLVPGRPLSQYSLGEYQDKLRIATTNEVYRSSGESLSSGVYVLGVNGTSLDTVGKIEGIAPGEKIYSARFLGSRGFLVTFRRIDPLFTLDLSDAATPRIVGELKVPGFSDHIQLLDENHLLTIGRNTVDSGDFAWVQGVLLTIFDISDMASPKIHTVNGEPARVEIGTRGSYSDAENDPKAFNYYGARNALAFPMNLYEGDATGPEYGTHSFTGLYVYRVTVANGFEFLGRIASAEGDTGGGCFQGYYGATRGVFIDNDVYSVTERGVKAAPIDTPSTLTGEVTYSGAEPLVTDCYYWVTPELALPASSDLR
jgi:uncharacterized secreted protein with C-terminal beta-propeller domain